MSETKTPWKKLQNKDYLGECDFLPGEEKVVTIAAITTNEITGTGGEVSNKPIMKFAEPVKPLIVNTTNFKTMQKLFQSRYVEDWLGKQVILYGDPSVKFGREVVGGVRIHKELPVAATEVCADCGQIIQDSGKFKAKSIAQSTVNTYGRTLCWGCAGEAKAARELAKQAGQPEPEQEAVKDNDNDS